MTVHHLPVGKPTREQLNLPIATICAELQKLSAASMQCQLNLMDAKDAEGFVGALRETRENIAAHVAGFDALLEITKKWQLDH